MDKDVRIKIEAISDTIKNATLDFIDDLESETGRGVSSYNILLITDTMKYYLDSVESILVGKLKHDYLSDISALLTEKEFDVIMNSKGYTFKQTIDEICKVTENESIIKFKRLLDDEEVDLNEEEVSDIEEIVYDIAILIRSYNREKLVEINNEIDAFSYKLKNL